MTKSIQAATIKRKDITLADVARDAKVSLSTVSQVINNRPSCWASQETRDRVIHAAKRLGYRPNLTARALRSGQSNTLGMITTGIGVGSSHSRFMGLDEAAVEKGYAVMLSYHPNTFETENSLIRRHLDRGVDGLFVYPTEPGPHLELQALVARNFPVVAFDAEALLDFPIDDVSPDFQEIGRRQASHLLDSGHRRFCIANALPSARINLIREKAACATITEAGMAAPLFMNLEIAAKKETSSSEKIDGPLHAFLEAHRGRFDAVITYDLLAALVVRNLLEMGVRVPEDVAVMGAGNSLVAEYNALPISSISVQDDLIGREAFRLFSERAAGIVPAGEFRRIQPPLKMLIRASTVKA